MLSQLTCWICQTKDWIKRWDQRWERSSAEQRTSEEYLGLKSVWSVWSVCRSTSLWTPCMFCPPNYWQGLTAGNRPAEFWEKEVSEAANMRDNSSQTYNFHQFFKLHPSVFPTRNFFLTSNFPSFRHQQVSERRPRASPRNAGDGRSPAAGTVGCAGWRAGCSHLEGFPKPLGPQLKQRSMQMMRMDLVTCNRKSEKCWLRPCTVWIWRMLWPMRPWKLPWSTSDC